VERIAVSSREIAVIGYDEKGQELEVTFRRGGVYLYRGVPTDIYQALMRADSLGTYFSRNIKDAFEFEKIS